MPIPLKCSSSQNLSHMLVSFNVFDGMDEDHSIAIVFKHLAGATTKVNVDSKA